MVIFYGNSIFIIIEQRLEPQVSDVVELTFVVHFQVV